MLSRRIIHRTPDETPCPTPRNRPDAHAAREEGLLAGRVWGRVVLLAALVILFVATVLLNAGAVVEPRVRVLWASYGRPSLLVVLLLTSLLSVACTIIAGALFRARRDLVDARGRSLTALVESEASRVKHVGVVRPAPAA